MKLAGVILLSVLALQVQPAAGLSAQEKALAAYIDAHNTEAEALPISVRVGHVVACFRRDDNVLDVLDHVMLAVR